MAKSLQNYLALSAAMLYLFLIGVTCYADSYIPPEQVSISTPVYRSPKGSFNPPLGLYTYDVKWQGIPAAEATIQVEQEGLRYKITTTARTYSPINIFYNLKYFAEGLISAVDFQPYKTIIRTKENSKEKSTEITFLGNGDITATNMKKGKNTEVKTFNTQNFTLDPFSAAFLARSLDWEKGESREFDTFNGKTRYLITLTAEDEITMMVNDKPRKVWVISPKVTNLSNAAKSKKLRNAQIYVTADNAREILKIKSSVFVGSVTTALQSFVPQGNQPNTILLAQRAGHVFIE